jgi:hypothetical protein
MPSLQSIRGECDSGYRGDILGSYRYKLAFSGRVEHLGLRPNSADPLQGIGHERRRSQKCPRDAGFLDEPLFLSVMISAAIKGPGSHASVKIVLSLRCSTLCERSSTRSATPLWARFLLARANAGFHESMPTTLSAGKARAASIASQPTPVPRVLLRKSRFAPFLSSFRSWVFSCTDPGFRLRSTLG